MLFAIIELSIKRNSMKSIRKSLSQRMSSELSYQINTHSEQLNQLANKYTLAQKAMIKLVELSAKSDNRVLFVTATGQAEANYYLIWQLCKIKQQKFSHIVIISTDYSQKKGFVTILKSLLKLPSLSLNAQSISELHIPNGKEEDLDFMKSLLVEWIIHHQPSQVIFNITGGTKLISIAQDHIANLSQRFCCVYQSSSTNQLLWFKQNEKNTKTEKLILPKDIKTRIKARGYQYQASENILNIEGVNYVDMLYRMLQEDFAFTQKFISFINYLCFDLMKLNDNQFPKKKQLSRSNVNLYESHLKQLSDVEQPFFSYLPDSQEIAFYSAQAVEYMGGKWFEVLTGYLIFQYFNLKNKSVDIQVGLKFKKESDGNEIDVAFLSDNGYLHFFECKTKNWYSTNTSNPTTTINENLHKLASISSVAGLNSHIYYVSLFEVTQESKKVAKDKNIHVISGEQLLNFAQYMVEE